MLLASVAGPTFWTLGPMPQPDQFANPTGGTVRGCDSYGCGHFGAPRGTSRTHDGADWVSTPGQDVFAPVNGKVVRVSAPYRNDPRYSGVLIESPRGRSVFVWYVSPSNKIIGRTVAAGDVIGTAQDLTIKYPARPPRRPGPITNHVHVRIWDRSGKPVDPTQLIP